MLRRGRVQKTHVKNELSLLLPIWCREKTIMNLAIRRRRRTSKRSTRSQNKQPLLKKITTKMVVALFAGVMSIG